MLHRTLLFLGLTGLFLVSAALADQPKKEVHSQADLPRATYPVTGSVSTLLQSDDSVFDSTVSKAATDLDALFSDYDIKDNATLISILSAKLSLQELKGDAVVGSKRSRGFANCSQSRISSSPSVYSTRRS